MKGFSHALDWFSEGLRARRSYRVCSKSWADFLSFERRQGLILLQVKDPHLLPSIVPNVFAISTSLSPSHSALQVLPSLFAVKEPPQNTMTLLDSLELLHGNVRCGTPSARVGQAS